MKALGKGSVASIVKVGLHIATIALWFAAAMLAVGAIMWIAVLAGWAPAETEHFRLGTGAMESDVVNVRPAGDERLDWPVMAPVFLIGWAVIAGALVIVGRLTRLFHNFTSGEPFSAENASHLRVIWITLIVLELSRYAIAGALALLVAIFGQPERVRIEVQPPLNLMTWGAILVLIVLAEVFREGARLREDEKLTI